MDATKRASQDATRTSGEERRRSSGQNKFANLADAKRNPTNDNAAQRRASLAEQSQKPGILGSLWNNTMKGGSADPK